MEIDLNCDLGEGAGCDEQLLPWITSASLACGFHAGDPTTALSVLRAARRCGVQVGAHPGFNDREHFGRRELDVPPEQVFADCVYQIGALVGLARAAGTTVRYVKPHGALYNMACREERLAGAVLEAVRLWGLPLVGLPGSQLEASANRSGYPFVAEGFADRRYLPDGSLVPRTRPDAFVEDPEEAVRQAEGLVQRGIRTLCVHGDNPRALQFVQALRSALLARGFTVRPFPTPEHPAEATPPGGAPNA
jgi:UPF0271 protein